MKTRVELVRSALVFGLDQSERILTEKISSVRSNGRLYRRWGIDDSVFNDEIKVCNEALEMLGDFAQFIFLCLDVFEEDVKGDFDFMILKCSCSHEVQDRLYGAGKRVHNVTKNKAEARCTVCEKIHKVPGASWDRGKSDDG